ncbi:MAG: hypothetical protein SPL55_03845 [Prevotella sp.]|nr:hypothetical protein [Prevotella sp.]
MMTTKKSWKPVTISGFTGILMGAGSMYAIEKANSDEVASYNAEEQVKVATIDDGLSFRQAFETAREEVGPGGVFRWHGNIYNTFTAEEWQTMSEQERGLFAQRVKPEISPADIDTNRIHESTPTDDVRLAENQDEPVQGEKETPVVAASEEIKSDDDDVRVVGFGHVEVADGRYVAVEEVDINGQRVAIIDVDNDGVADIAMSDINHNGQPDEGEIIDLHTGEALAFTNDETLPTDDMAIMADDEQSIDEGTDMINFTL